MDTFNQAFISGMQTILKIKQENPNCDLGEEAMKVGFEMIAEGLNGLLECEKPMITKTNSPDWLTKLGENVDKMFKERFPETNDQCLEEKATFRTRKLTQEQADKLFNERFPDLNKDHGGKPTFKPVEVTLERANELLEQANKALDDWPGGEAGYEKDLAYVKAKQNKTKVEQPETEVKDESKPQDLVFDNETDFVKALGDFENFPSLASIGIPKGWGSAWAERVHNRVHATAPKYGSALNLLKLMVLSDDKEGLYCLGKSSSGLSYSGLMFMVKQDNLPLVKLWFQLFPKLGRDQILMNRSKVLRRAINSASLELFKFLTRIANLQCPDVRADDNLLLQRAARYDEDICRWLCKKYCLHGPDIKANDYKALRCARENDNMNLMLHLAKLI